jgi:hypothetical protein
MIKMTNKVYTVETRLPYGPAPSASIWSTLYLPFPLDWKKDEYYRKLAKKPRKSRDDKMEFKRNDTRVIESTPKRAFDRVQKRIQEAFGGLKRNYDGYEEKPEARETYKFSSKYYDIQNAKEPLYFVKGFDIKGVIFTFNEIEKLAKEKKIPELFVKYPKLIPEKVYVPERGGWYNEDKAIPFNGEFTQEVIEALLIHQEENNRGIGNLECGPLEIVIERMKRLYLFSEEICFWVYKPDTGFRQPRFQIYRFPIGNWFIGTRKEVKEHIQRYTSHKVNQFRSSARNMKKSLEKRIKKVAELPYSIRK